MPITPYGHRFLKTLSVHKEISSSSPGPETMGISTNLETTSSIPDLRSTSSSTTLSNKTNQCTEREGTSFTVLFEKYINSTSFLYHLEIVLNGLSSRFPCVTRKYTSITLDNEDLSESITTKKDSFLQSIKTNNFNSETYLPKCNQSLLYGLKRTLEISPAESIIAVLTSGSMTDYNDAQLLSDVYTLLEEKKSQVYFLFYLGYCTVSASQESIFNNISLISFGEFIRVNDYNYYQLVNSLELLLSKPRNSSVHILNLKLKVTDQYTEVFHVTASLSYLLVTRDDKFTMNFTDPNERSITLEENPNILYYYSNLTDYGFISSSLVKSPAEGSWTLNAWGNGLLTVQILGFTGFNISGNCSDSDCHPNATCGEFGGDQQCTCKVGFAGDGTYCDDINECQDPYANICNYGGGTCVNTVGSYTCKCNTGFEYKEGFGCVDINECADSSLNNCLPLEECTNGYGSYNCTCPSKYYVAGSYSCVDPCYNHTVLNDTWRSTSNVYNTSDYWSNMDWYHCDSGLIGWYRFKGESNLQIPEYCIPEYSCGTYITLYLGGSHPKVEDGIVNLTACLNWFRCCWVSTTISVKMCPEGFYVYKIKSIRGCHHAYCTEIQANTTTAAPSTTLSTTVPINTSSNVQNVTSKTPTLADNTTITMGPPSSTVVKHYTCTARGTLREGTSFTLLTDTYLTSLGFSSNLESVLNELASRFPCVTRQYTSIKLDYAETNETITTEQSYFLQSIKANYEDAQTYQHLLECNQSLLYGLRRALEISPAESMIAVFTSGSMTDYNDTQLLSEVHTLLEEKKSQVYFLLYPGYCTMNATQEEIFNNISSISFTRTSVVNDSYYNQQLLHSMELLLTKPLNSSVMILGIKLNVIDQYTEAFNITTSLSYLLITRDDKFTINFTDPNENTLTLEENPNILHYNFNVYDHVFISSRLVKSPAAGTWILNAWGNGSLTVQILGFTGFNTSGNCSDSDCNPNATCGEFGGDQQCTCKVGFAGNGTYCEDIDECQDGYTNNCVFYGGGTCVNTIGSYTCKCNTGFKYKEESGCVDIDECADSALNNCLPLAVCTNGYGSYACSCPSKYYELGSNSCTDPCSNHTVRNDPWRSTSNIHNYTDYLYNFDWARCDLGMYGWYRFQGEHNLRIPEYCVPLYSCGVHAPMWLNGLHPTVEEGIANLTACANWIACCMWSRPILVKMCPKGFYVYKIQSTPQCWYGYCTENQVNTTTTTPTTAFRTTLPTAFTTLYTTRDIQNVTSGFTSTAHDNSTFLTMETPTTGTPYTTAITNTSCSVGESNVSSANSQCFPNEECRIVNEVSGCYCTPSLNYTTVFGYAMPEDISTECGMNQITVSYSKCNIELLGFNTSSLHLKDNNCMGVPEIRDIRYITVTTLPRSGHCGTELVESSSYFTYTNVAYLSSAFSLLTFSTNISCTYPRSMKNVLWFSTSVLVSESNLSLGGASSYAVRMGIFQDSNYTILYDDPEGWIDIHVPLYIGISVEDKTPSTAVLLMKSCLLTTTSDTDTARYNIISDYCPYLNASSLYVEENGVSLQGRLSLDIADFAGNYSRLYIECQIILCNTTLGTCSPNCSQTNPAIMDKDMDIANLTVGPLFIKGDILSLFLLIIIIYL